MRPDPVSALAVRLPQHPDEHRPEGPVLLAVDQLRLVSGELYVGWLAVVMFQL
jgi:hypothetical protein